jgi:hypothetical protein
MMDKQLLFDTLTVRLSERSSRADVLRWLGRFVLAMVIFGVFPWRVRGQSVDPESQLVKGCRLPGQKCNNNKDCCSRKCAGSAKRCGCRNKGAEPIVDTPLGPVPIKALCCSNKLNKRTGECR